MLTLTHTPSAAPPRDPRTVKPEDCDCMCHDPRKQVIMHCFGPPCCSRPQVKRKL